MYKSLGSVTLRTGEVVEAGVIHGPDHAWAERLTKLLRHKGDPWNWQNAQCLERDLGIDVLFHVLHRDGEPLANIMTVEHQGVGHFGHVWTEPGDRRKGASKLLMGLQMGYFQERGGRALYLSTGYDSVAYHIYCGYGFESIEPHSGYMAYYATDVQAFHAAYFPAPPAEKDEVNNNKEIPQLARFAWQDWTAAAPLLLGDYRGMVRCAPWGMVGRHSPESYLLPALLREEKRAARNQSPQTLVLRHPTTDAVVGIAAWNEHPLWSDICLVDLYCHPNYWNHAARLWQALELPEMARVIAYVDDSDRYKLDFFMDQTFKPIATLPEFTVRDVLGKTRVDVTVLQRNGSIG